MMSQDLVVVLTKVQRANGASASSSVRLRLFLPLLTALIVCGLTAGRADAQQAASSQTPQGTQSTPASAEASHAATGPVVTYQHGQLTIVAENASLSQIMAALHTAMGTEVEIPAGSSTERVWAHLGPGSAHKILVDLFANTDLDYIIQGSSTDSGAIQSIALSLRTPDGGPGKPGPGDSAESAAARRMQRFTSAPAPEPSEPEVAPPPAQEASASAATTAPATPPTADAAAPVPTPEPVPTISEQAGMTPTGTPNIFPQTPQPSAGSFNPHPSPPPTMSTDQMVQQLSNMYQQRRQMQQGQTGSTPN